MWKLKQRSTKLYNGEVVREGDMVQFVDSDGILRKGPVKRDSDKKLYFWNNGFDIKRYRQAEKVKDA